MKTLLLGIFYLGFASLIHSQTIVKTVALENVIIKPLNTHYLNIVKEKNAPQIVKNLENKAARFDVTKGAVYNDKFYGYKVEFNESSKKGTIVATYNENGKIIKTFEKFVDIKLPNEVKDAVYKAYPDWKIYSDTYFVTYFHDRGVNKVYKIKIIKGNKKKTIKVTPKGKLK